MRKYSLMTCVAVLLLAALTLAAADFTGKWAGEVQGRNGQARPITFTFKQDGAALTGTMVGPMGREVPISDGKVDGDNISFLVKMEFQGNEVKITYTGTIDGDGIKMKSQREGSDRVQEFTAKKAS